MAVALAERPGPGRSEAAGTALAALRRAGLSDEALEGAGLAAPRLAAGQLERGDGARVDEALRAVEPAHRERAAHLLVEAYWRLPTSPSALEAAARQLEQAAATGAPAARQARLEQAARLLDGAVERHGRASTLALAAEVYAALGAAAASPRHVDRAIAMAQRLAELDPNGIGAWMRLGDLRFLAGDRGRAAIAYRRALRADENFVLDPLKRLPEAERRRIEARVAEAEPGAGG
jgi:tetratricopeptide (TPR) repeat protein